MCNLANECNPMWLFHCQPYYSRALRSACQGGNPVQRIENITLGILSEVLIRAIPKGLKVNFILSASICRMATAFFSFWAALIKIYSYFRLYTFMSIYVKILLTLFMSCQSPFAKPYLTLKEAEFDKQLATYS